WRRRGCLFWGSDRGWVGESGGLAALLTSRNEGVLHRAEEVLEAFLAGVAGIMPGAPVPEARLAARDLGIPLVDRQADMVLLGHAHRHRIGEEFVELGHSSLVEV